MYPTRRRTINTSFWSSDDGYDNANATEFIPLIMSKTGVADIFDNSPIMA